jgi:SAM-dependent methyltransferase
MYICPICNHKNIPNEHQLKWPRNNLKCLKCKSNVRQRSLFLSLINLNLDLKKIKIHHFSPSQNCSVDRYLKDNVTNYEISRYWDDLENGKYRQDVQCINLENILLPDNCYDILLTMDIFEHILNPDKAIKEIYRILKPGGYYLMTVPIDSGLYPTEKPINMENGRVTLNKTKVGNFKGFREKPEYHGNPNDPSGSIVTHYWGYDIIEFLKDKTDFIVSIDHLMDNKQNGILGVMNECIVCYKPKIPQKKIVDIKEISEDKKKYYGRI